MTLLDHYHDLCQKNNLREDAEQQVAIKKLDLLKQRLESRKRWFSLWPEGLLGQNKPLRGLYLFGGVGRGKTMLMDLFYDHVKIEKKARYHFHEFMQMIHHKVKALSSSKSRKHPLETIAKDIYEDARLICFDEFHFKDITDAMLLKRLFHFLGKEGVIIVATSNFHPEHLYQNGYQRNLVLPFLKKLAQTLELCDLETHTDYRQAGSDADYSEGEAIAAKLTKAMRHCVGDFVDCKQILWKQFQSATNYAPIEQLELLVNGRSWWLPCVSEGIMFASFNQLCGEPVGSQDYLALTKRIHSLYLWGVPELTDEDLDKVKRFITLIDILYDKKTDLHMASQKDIHQIYSQGKESDLFERTKSRLSDMLRPDLMI